MMPTFTQAILLGSERLSTAPAAPHPALSEAWAQLDWTGAKETALLEASALAGAARSAGALVVGPLPVPDIAPDEAQPLCPPRAIAVLRQLIAEEWRPLLPEWLELCTNRGFLVPPFFLRTLFEIISRPEERTLLLRAIGERGRWLARQNADWSWVNAAAPSPDGAAWETGGEEERLASLHHARMTEPRRATGMLAATWADDPPDFRIRALQLLSPGLSLSDEPLLTRALADRRKEVRSAAQALLASLPSSGLAVRSRTRAETVLTLHRGLLGKKLEMSLPAGFEAPWKADAIDEKPPAGVGERAHWAQQILGLVPLAYWTDRFAMDAASLVSLAVKSADWTDLLLGAWFRSACIHRDAEASTALIRPLLARPKALPPGMSPQAAAAALLVACNESDRWRIVATEPDIAWHVLPLLTGTSSSAEARALFEHLWRALRDGFNPGGSPTAVLAARRISPELREEAAARLAREDGLSKPAETFLRALELRAELHAAFSDSTPNPRRS